MSKRKHTEAQSIGSLRQVEAGRTAEDVAREQGVSKHTIYAWKAKYGGMEVSEVEEVKRLRDENTRLKTGRGICDQDPWRVVRGVGPSMNNSALPSQHGVTTRLPATGPRRP